MKDVILGYLKECGCDLTLDQLQDLELLQPNYDAVFAALQHEATQEEAATLFEAIQNYDEKELERELEHFQRVPSIARPHYLTHDASLECCFAVVQSNRYDWDVKRYAALRLPHMLLARGDYSETNHALRVAEMLDGGYLYHFFKNDKNWKVRKEVAIRGTEVPYDLVSDEYTQVRILAFRRLPEVAERDARFREEKHQDVREATVSMTSPQLQLEVLHTSEAPYLVYHALKALPEGYITDELTARFLKSDDWSTRRLAAQKTQNEELLRSALKTESDSDVQFAIAQRLLKLSQDLRSETEERAVRAEERVAHAEMKAEYAEKQLRLAQLSMPKQFNVERLTGSVEELRKLMLQFRDAMPTHQFLKMSNILQDMGAMADPVKGDVFTQEIHGSWVEDTMQVEEDWYEEAKEDMAGMTAKVVEAEAAQRQAVAADLARLAVRAKEKEAVEEKTVAGTIAGSMASALAERIAGTAGAMVTAAGRDVIVTERVEKALTQ